MSGWYAKGGKRLLDIALSGMGLLAFALPMAWIAWWIYRGSGRSPLFRQPRIGYGGKPFVIIKFRTMSDSKEVLPFCKGLRATAMDELPQLIHILRGQMSFVGPRPLIPEELQELRRIPGGARRLLVRPGLAGLAQLNDIKVPSLPERLKWDFAYVEQCSLRLDLRILLRSLVVTMKGAWEREMKAPPGGP